ncbi:MAG TPA: PQQ-binding-like beta-propeller repeat protein [Candidatus Binatia bacterium]|nr:PQQ-binding-like beta-propeller repeat protein [Candidatus Binatia bacterium]
MRLAGTMLSRNRTAMPALALVLATLAACSDASSPSGVATGPGATVDDWTMLGQNFSSTFNNTSEKILAKDNVSGLKEAWRFETRGTVTGAPAVKDGIVYVLSSGGAYAFRGADGTVVWENPGVTGTSSPTWSDGKVFVNDGDSVLHALDAATGAEIWRSVIDDHRFAAGFSSPVAFERYVIVGSSSVEEAGVSENATFRGAVVAFDRDTGAELWRHFTTELPFNGASVWATVSIDPLARLVFADTGNNYTEEAGPTSDSIFALDVDTGALRWLTQLTEGDVFTILNMRSPDTDFGTNPILFEAEVAGARRKVVGAGQKSGVFWLLDRDTGEVLWSRAISPGSALIGGMLNNGAFDGRHILVAGNNGKSDGPGSVPSTGAFGPGTTSVLMALDPKDGSTVWERQIGAWVWQPLTVANGVGYVGIDNVVQAFDTDTGEILFEFPTGGTIAAGITVAEGRVHIGSGLSYFVGTPNRMVQVLSLEGGGGGGGGGGPTFDPTLSAIYDEIIVAKGCTTTSCHGSNQGNLSMRTKDEAYGNLVGVPAAGPSCASSGLVRVVAGDPAASLLLDKVSHATPVCGGPMPPTGPLSQQEIDQIRQWIERGAPND